MPTTCDIYFENNPFKIIYTDQFLRGVACDIDKLKESSRYFP